MNNTNGYSEVYNNLMKDFLEDSDNISKHREYYIEEFGEDPTIDELIDYMKESFFDEFGVYEELSAQPNKDINYSPFNKLLGTLFLVWFIASFVGLIYFSETNATMAIIIFGQYFLVFGIIMLLKKIGFGGVFTIIGGGILFAIFAYNNPELIKIKLNFEFIGILIGALCFLGFGLGIFIWSILSVKKEKEKCSLPVYAKVIRLVDGGKCPIYSFYHNGKTVKVRGKSNKNNILNIGDEVKLMVNPNKVKDAYFEEKTSNWILLFCILLPFTLAGIYLLFMAFTEYLN